MAIEPSSDATGLASVSREPTATRPPAAENADSRRRAEILQTAETLIATYGLRTSLQEIASAAGILTGSLYHHFASRDALLLELVRRYHSDLAHVGSAGLERLDAHDSITLQDKIIELGTAIAHCAVRNRAALQMSFYDAPSEDSDLVVLLDQRQVSVQDAMVQTLRAGRWSGYVRPDLDLSPLADRFCQSMLHVGLDVIRRDASAAEVAPVLCHIMLEGLSSRPHDDEALDSSAAMLAANDVISAWGSDDNVPLSTKETHIRTAARVVFGRKGFEVTSIRDIAAAAVMNAATVYRVIGSKDELLASIMQTFGEKTESASSAVMDSDSTPIEKLDALSWIYINAVIQFPDEWKIQLAWMRQSPPDNPNPGYAFSTRMSQLQGLLAEGERTGDIKMATPSIELLSRCVMDVLWIPENILREIGARSALTLARDTVIRGIACQGERSDGKMMRGGRSDGKMMRGERSDE